MSVYEDISRDGDHMLDTSANLHMSVDETDHVTLSLDQDVVGKMCDKKCLRFLNHVKNKYFESMELGLVSVYILYTR